MSTVRKKALVIGISDYLDEDNFDCLPACKNDANLMITILKKLNYDMVNTNQLGKVDYDTLKEYIKNFFMYGVDPQDLLLFYFSGHGIITEDGEYFLITSSTNYDEPYFNGYSFDDLFKMANRSKSRRIVFILDCCYSGGLILSQERLDKYYTRFYNENDHNTVVCMLLSSQPYSESFYNKRNISIFTEYIIEGLRGNPAAVNDSGFITPESLFGFVYDKVLSIPDEDRNNQRPIIKMNHSLPKILAVYPDVVKSKEKLIVGVMEDENLGPKQVDGFLNSFLRKGEQYIVEGNYIKSREYFSNSTIHSFTARLYHDKGLSNMEIKDFRNAINDFDIATKIDPKYSSAWNYKAICYSELSEFDNAIDCFNKAIEHSPIDYGIWYNKGLCFLKQYKNDEAIINFEKSIEINPYFYDALNNLGICFIIRKSFSEATKLFERIIDENPYDTVVLNNLSLSLNGERKYDEALTTINKAITCSMDDPRLYHTKGILLEEKGYDNFNESLKCYEKAIELDKQFVDSIFRKGILLAKQENHEAAEMCFQNVIEINNKNYNAWYNKATSCHKQGKLQEALDDINKAIEIKPNDYLLWYSKGTILLDIKEYRDAIKCYEKCIQLNPSFGDCYYNMGLAYNKIDDRIKALECYNQALLTSLPDSMTWMNKGLIYLSLGNTKLANACYEKSISLDSSNARAWANKGNLIMQVKGNPEDAIKYYEKAMSLDPLLIRPGRGIDYTHALSNMGMKLYSSKKYNEAIRYCDRALAIDPFNSHAFYTKGLVFFDFKDYTESIKHFEKAFELDKTSPEIKTGLKYSLNNYGALLAYRWNHAEAITYFDKAISIDPLYHQAWANKGKSLVMLNRKEEADFCIKKANEIRCQIKDQAW